MLSSVLVFTTVWKKAQPDSVQLLHKNKWLFLEITSGKKRGFGRQELTCSWGIWMLEPWKSISDGMAAHIIVCTYYSIFKDCVISKYSFCVTSADLSLWGSTAKRADVRLLFLCTVTWDVFYWMVKALILWVWKDVVWSVSQVGHTAHVIKPIKGLMLPNYTKHWLLYVLLKVSQCIPPSKTSIASIKMSTGGHSFLLTLSLSSQLWDKIRSRSSQISVVSANTRQIHRTIVSQANVSRQSTIWCGISTTALVFL